MPFTFRITLINRHSACSGSNLIAWQSASPGQCAVAGLLCKAFAPLLDESILASGMTLTVVGCHILDVPSAVPDHKPILHMCKLLLCAGFHAPPVCQHTAMAGWLRTFTKLSTHVQARIMHHTLASSPQVSPRSACRHRSMVVQVIPTPAASRVGRRPCGMPSRPTFLMISTT